MSKKLVYSLLMIFLFVSAGLILFFNLSSNSGAADYAANCSKDSSDYISCLTVESLNQAKKSGPEQALNNLEEYFKKSPYEVDCHIAYHSIGATFYREFNENSYINGAGECFGAYYHGIIIETSNSYRKDAAKYAENLMNFCKTFTKTDLLYCIHGIGHGAYYVTGGDVEAAEKICRETPSGVECAMGIFMEIVEDEANATKYGMDTFKNFQAENCDIFTSKTLYIACYIQTHLGVNVVEGKTITDVCSYNEEKDCKLYYGVALSTTILTHYPDYNTSRMENKYRKMIQECLGDDPCAIGFINSSKGLLESDEKVEKYCLTLLEAYGDMQNKQKCLDRHFIKSL